MKNDDDATLIPLDDVAYQNDWLMAQGIQACVGYDGVTRPFTIPLAVRQGWAKAGIKNPYTHRVEVELLDTPEPPRRKRWWQK